MSKKEQEQLQDVLKKLNEDSVRFLLNHIVENFPLVREQTHAMFTEMGLVKKEWKVKPSDKLKITLEKQ